MWLGHQVTAGIKPADREASDTFASHMLRQVSDVRVRNQALFFPESIHPGHVFRTKDVCFVRSYARCFHVIEPTVQLRVVLMQVGLPAWLHRSKLGSLATSVFTRSTSEI